MEAHSAPHQTQDLVNGNHISTSHHGSDEHGSLKSTALMVKLVHSGTPIYYLHLGSSLTLFLTLKSCFKSHNRIWISHKSAGTIYILCSLVAHWLWSHALTREVIGCCDIQVPHSQHLGRPSASSPFHPRSFPNISLRLQPITQNHFQK